MNKKHYFAKCSVIFVLFTHESISGRHDFTFHFNTNLQDRLRKVNLLILAVLKRKIAVLVNYKLLKAINICLNTPTDSIKMIKILF